MKFIKFLVLPLLISSVLWSCKKEYLDTQPSNAVAPSAIYDSTTKVRAALDGVYKFLFAFAANGNTGHDNFGQKAWDLDNDLMGNDMIVHTQGYGWFNRTYQYNEFIRPQAGSHPDNAWFYYYNIIKNVNVIMKNLEGAKGGTQADKEMIKGECLGLRAYAYFYLANYWQQTYKGNETKPGVPVYTEPVTDGVGRGKLEDVYNRISQDLNDAETLLNGKTRASKVQFDVTVVRGFKARVALLKEDWAAAAAAANAAKASYTLMTPTQYQSGFNSIASPEWMWGALIPSTEATIFASFFSHLDAGANGGVSYAGLGGQKKITKALYDQIPTGDVRKTLFRAPGTGNTQYPDYTQLKFRLANPSSWAADYLFMRAAEMYLIEAEALARQGQDAQAKTVLETLVKQRFPAYTAPAGGSALLNEIYLQRRIELWGEGFSLMDIKRLKTGLSRPTGTGNHGAPNFNPVVYTTLDADARFLMKIPQSEIDNSGVMTAADQNP